MNKKEIQSVWAAFQEVQEKKKAPVTNKDDDGEGMDPVGKADGDIDNDGDKDSSDEYLANRRKKIGKEIEKDKDVKEGKYSGKKMSKSQIQKELDKLDKAFGSMKKGGIEYDRAMDDYSELKQKLKEGEEASEVECPKCKGEGCDHCDGKGYHKVKKETYGKKMKESALFSEEELAALEEKMKQPNDSGTKAEPFMSTSSPKEKKVMDDHKAGSDKKLEDMEDAGELDAANAGKAVKTQSPPRRGEKRIGHLAMEKPLDSEKIVRGAKDKGQI